MVKPIDDLLKPLDDAISDCNVIAEFSENSENQETYSLSKTYIVTAASPLSHPMTQLDENGYDQDDKESVDYNDMPDYDDPEGSTEKPKDDKEQESIMAGAIADDLMDQVCFDEIGGDWSIQKGGLWGIVTEKKALKIIMGELKARMPKGFSFSKVNSIKSFLQILLLCEKWDDHKHLLPMINGVLDTQTMTLSDYSYKHRFNWQLPYAYNPNAKLEVIRSWLWGASGKDLESINIIRAFFRMALISGDVQKFLELVGAGGTGKSTLVRLLVAFIGEKNSVTTDLKQLETNKFEAAALYGKHLAIINDSSRYCGEVSTLKALTGGDPVRLEKKNVQQSGSFVFDGVVVIASNEAIQTADYTSGLIRRRMPVNFNRIVTDEDKAKWASLGGIEAAMHNELPALLNWVLAMTPAEVKAAIGGINGQMSTSTLNHLVETNKIAAWLDDNIVIVPRSVTYIGGSTKGKDDDEKRYAVREKLYPNYEAWCNEGAVHPVALQRFTASVIDVCNTLKLDVSALAKNKHGRSLLGLAIREDKHLSYATPVTKKLLGDEDNYKGDEWNTPQSRASDEGDPDDLVNLSVIKESIEIETPEYF